MILQSKHIGNPALVIAFALISMASWAQSNIFVSTTGDDSSGDGTIDNPFRTIGHAAALALPGDTVFVRAGTYRNADFDDGDIWTGETVAQIECDGAENNYITFTPHPGEEAIIEFDGTYGILVKNASYVRVVGFVFDGVADDISEQEAVDAWGLYKDASGVIHDLSEEMGIDITDPALIGQTLNKPPTPNIQKPSKYNGRALVANSSHHIEFLENTVRNVPSSAIRAQQSDYVTIARNTVSNNTYWTSQGVGAITVAEATVLPEGDTYDGVKIMLLQNNVYENENRLISWNPSKSFVNFVIDEGTGLFLTRNKNTYAHGRILISNNLSYLNGASGIVCHHTNRAIIEHNSTYGNGTTNHGTPGGIGVNASDDVMIVSNIAYSQPHKWALGILAEPVTNLEIDANIVFNNNGSVDAIRNTSANPLASGWVETNPLFVNGTSHDFSLTENSPAIDSGSDLANQAFDYFGEPRDENPDIGAIEYLAANSVTGQPGAGQVALRLFPNPTRDILHIEGVSLQDVEVRIHDLTGRESRDFRIMGSNMIDLSGMAEGAYILRTENASVKLFKR